MLTMADPHIARALQNAQAATRMRQKWQAASKALTADDQALMCIGHDGRVTGATAQAVHYLERFSMRLSSRRRRASPLLQNWIDEHLHTFRKHTVSKIPIAPLRIDRGHESLTIRLTHADGSIVLLLKTHLKTHAGAEFRSLGLTTRETETLKWLTFGKTNPEIGKILGISPRTVQKHLERVYKRLGVENRHAAMRVALDTMRTNWAIP